jgi:hypothetical protein
MLHAQGMKYTYWAEAVMTAAYIRNRCPAKALGDITPEEVWTGKPPSIAHLRTFGCVAYAHVAKEKRTKLESKSVKCIFLGYYEGSKAWRLYNPVKKQVIKSRDVIFKEDSEMSGKTPSESSGSMFELPVDDKVHIEETEHKMDGVPEKSETETSQT